ncbi:MAG: hypothetical protein L7V85_08370 [Bacteroidia bacterium]|nr:hypothetical protein [Bacteroidia bacterium]
MRIRFLIEFGGFYDSIHSYNIDDRIDVEAHHTDEDLDYQATKENYCVAYVEQLNNELDLNLKFEELWSPRFYNFETDKIDASITLRDYKKLRKESLEDEDLKKYIEENSKSRDGFTSFYSGWQEVIDNDEIFLGYIFQYYHSQENFDREILENHDYDLAFKEELPREFIPQT